MPIYPMSQEEARALLAAEAATPWSERKFDNRSVFRRNAAAHLEWTAERFRPGERVVCFKRSSGRFSATFVRAEIHADVVEVQGEPGNPLSWGFYETIPSLVLVVQDDEGVLHNMYPTAVSPV